MWSGIQLIPFPTIVANTNTDANLIASIFQSVEDILIEDVVITNSW